MATWIKDNQKNVILVSKEIRIHYLQRGLHVVLNFLGERDIQELMSPSPNTWTNQIYCIHDERRFTSIGPPDWKTEYSKSSCHSIGW